MKRFDFFIIFIFLFVQFFRAVFESMVKKHFPAPHRRFVGGGKKEDEKEKTAKKRKSKSSDRRSSSSKPKPNDFDVRSRRSPAKKPRVVYSDDESDSDVVIVSSGDSVKGFFLHFLLLFLF